MKAGTVKRKTATTTDTTNAPVDAPLATVRRMNAPVSVQPRIITRKFTLDHPLGEVVITMRGPAGAAKLLSSHTSLSISTDGEPDELPSTSTRARSRSVVQTRPLSGDPNEPGGTVEASLDGEDSGDAAQALTPDALSFLRSAEKDLLRRSNQE